MISSSRRALAAVVVGLLALSACGESGGETSTTTDPPPTQDAGGPIELDFNVTAMASAGSSVWAVDGTRLVQVDPESGEALTEVELDLRPQSVRGTPAGSEAFDDDSSSGFIGETVGVTGPSIWIAGEGRGPLIEVDTTTGETTQTITAAGFTGPVTASDGRVYAVADVHSVAAVGAASGEVVAQTRVGPVCGMALDQSGGLWVGAQPDVQSDYSLAEPPLNRPTFELPVRLLRLDAQSLAVTGEINVDEVVGAGFGCQFIGADDGVWLAGQGDDADTVAHLDGAGQLVGHTEARPFCCGPLAASGDTVWFIDGPSETGELAVLKRWHLDSDEVETIDLADQIGVAQPLVETMLLLDPGTALVTVRAGDPASPYPRLVVIPL